MSLQESTDGINSVLQKSADWKLSQIEGIKPPASVLEEQAQTVKDEPEKMEPSTKEEEDEEEEEEEEEDDDELEVKLDLSVAPDAKKQPYFQPISLQQTNGQPINKHFVPTPSQNTENIFDAEYVNSQSDRPWNQPGADITDYFNYGFTEKTWEAYHNKQKKKRSEFSMQSRISVYDSNEQSPKENQNHHNDYQDRGNARNDRNWQDRDNRSQRRPMRASDDIVQLGGENRGDEYTITPTESHRADSRDRREERGSRTSRRDEMPPRREDSSRRDDRGRRDEMPSRGDDGRRDDRRSREASPRSSSDRRRDGSSDRRRDYRDDRVSGRKRNDYPGQDSDRKRSKHY